ncbi:unnamed protein product [Rotaria sordida]|uniref:NHL repeat containing protein n=1 Tax=Rotaria sordida TaxID=392033 RepID=A0A813ZW49_9BILA|nr:unnamed protein product [Rotaria sordida]CAF1432868.1 unnamed protein product [Rotaria sordida]
MFDLYSPCRLDDVQSIEASIIKFTHHRQSRSLKSRRHYPASLKSRFRNIIHATIRGKSNTRFTDPESVDQHHHRDKSRRTSISKSPVKRSEITRRPVSTSKIHRVYPLRSQSNWNIWKNDDSKKNLQLQSNYSARTENDREYSHQTIFKTKKCPSKSSKSIDDNFHHIKTIDAEPDRRGTTEDYHQNSKRNKKKKCPRYCKIASVIAVLVLGIGIVILLALLIKPKATETTTIITTTCTSGTFWNTIGVTYAGNGSQGSALNQLSSPTGIFIDSSDILYINDGGNYRSLKYLSGATSGILIAGTGTSGSASNQLGGSTRFNYVDSNQNIYISDGSNNRVMRWANGASMGVIVAGDGTSGTSLNQTRTPYGVWVDSSSNVFVAEFTNHRVTRWSSGAKVGVVVAGGNLQGTTPDKLSAPSGIFFDETNQDLYIVNGIANTVVKWRVGASNGTVLAGVPGSSGVSSTYLSFPVDLTLDRWNNIYVADRTNVRIQLFCNGSSTGITIAGSGSSLILPYSVALDSQLNLYVSDNGAARIIKFSKL